MEIQMAVERTLSIIKPDGVAKNVVGDILNRFEKAGLKIVGMKLKQLSIQEAQTFYGVHSERPFFGELTEWMASGPVVISCLEGENAIAVNRDLMGATNPADAAEGTIRKDHAASVGENTVHGSDAVETALEEISYFFSGSELVG